MEKEEFPAFLLIFILIFAALHYSGAMKKVVCSIPFLADSFLGKIYDCGGSVVIPTPQPPSPPNPQPSPDGGGGGSSGGGSSGGGTGVKLVGGAQGSTYTGPTGALYLASPVSTAGLQYSGVPALSRLYSSSYAPLPGTFTPIKGVTIWINTATLKQPGWYKVAVRAYYKSCGPNNNEYILPDQNVQRVGIYGEDGKLVGVGEIVVGASGSGTCLTKDEVEKIVARYCPSNYLQAPPNYAYICMFYHDMKATGNWDKVKNTTTMCPMTGGQRTAFIVTRDELVKLVGSPCQQYGVDYLIVDYKVLYCGDGKQPGGQCTDYTSWQNGVYLRVDISPHTTNSNPTDVGWFYTYGGYTTLEVNGYVYSIIPLQSLFGGDFMVINWNETLATAGISLLLTGTGFLLIRKSRRLRR
jgi:hypothetical protein